MAKKKTEGVYQKKRPANRGGGYYPGWYITYHDADGNKHNEKGGDTFTEAKSKLRKILGEVEAAKKDKTRGKKVTREQTVADFLEDYERTGFKPDWNEGWADTNRTALRYFREVVDVQRWVHDLEPADAVDFVSHLQRKPNLGPRSVRAYFACVRRCFNVAVTRRLITTCPFNRDQLKAANVTDLLPQEPDVVEEWLTPDEVSTLIGCSRAGRPMAGPTAVPYEVRLKAVRQALDHECDPDYRGENSETKIAQRLDVSKTSLQLWKRLYREGGAEALRPTGRRQVHPFLWQLMTVSYETGARLAELKVLKWSDVRFEERQVLLRCGKGRRLRQRLVPLREAAVEALESLDRNGPYVFQRDGQPIGRLSKVFKTALREAGLPEHHVFHVLRHSFATHLRQEKAELAEIQALLGHAAANMTLRYAHHDAATLRAAVDRLPERKPYLRVVQS